MNTLAKQLALYKQKLEAQQAPSKQKDRQMVTTAKKPKNRVSTETKDKILELYTQGYNGTQIDQKLGLGTNTASYHIRKMKKAKTQATSFNKPKTNRGGRPKITPEIAAEMAEKFAKGWTRTRIAKRFKCHLTTVSYTLEKLGVTSPPKEVVSEVTPEVVYNTKDKVTTKVMSDELTREKIKNEILMEMLERANRR